MPLPKPEMAKEDTMLFRLIKMFHERLVDRLAMTKKNDTLRRAAWQLDEYIQENKQYKDVEYLKTLLSTLEWIIEREGGFKWTVEKAKRSLRGRTTNINQYKAKNRKGVMLPGGTAPIPKNLKRGLESRMMAKEKDPSDQSR